MIRPVLAAAIETVLAMARCDICGDGDERPTVTQLRITRRSDDSLRVSWWCHGEEYYPEEWGADATEALDKALGPHAIDEGEYVAVRMVTVGTAKLLRAIDGDALLQEVFEGKTSGPSAVLDAYLDVQGAIEWLPARLLAEASIEPETGISARIKAVGELIADHGCDCTCGHEPGMHADCTPCLGCRIDALLNPEGGPRGA